MSPLLKEQEFDHWLSTIEELHEEFHCPEFTIELIPTKHQWYAALTDRFGRVAKTDPANTPEEAMQDAQETIQHFQANPYDPRE
jgi:hypothetical protein